ncbi:hypothetical protein Slin_2501 [Spirosoma linguale DSM 74]|uniref:SIR2-like domain-containing protein n=2 Tax=Spirosoma TaxID=107 RepID=D2QGL2_SPILD|nr:hypothetical protein Slin_2501 [Spirosoma linguale DSM 74]
MVDRVQNLILHDDSWSAYKELYYYLRSCIQFADGIFGNFEASFNIEKLLIVINELEKKERNSIFPFIGAWDNRLLDLAGENFKKLAEFKEKIRTELVNQWVKIPSYKTADYYNGFTKLQFGENGLGIGLKVFSLNYDLCFEKIVGQKTEIELGFDESGEWSYNNFELSDSKSYTLYKLHGSLDWYTDANSKKLKQSSEANADPLLIFGEINKLRAIDPYLFYIYEFRRFCFHPDLKLIICIGYSFSDDHINDIISQAVKNKAGTKVLTTIHRSSDDRQNEILKSLKLSTEFRDRVIFEQTDAKQFLGQTLCKEYLITKIDNSADTLFAS